MSMPSSAINDPLSSSAVGSKTNSTVNNSSNSRRQASKSSEVEVKTIVIAGRQVEVKYETVKRRVDIFGLRNSAGVRQKLMKRRETKRKTSQRIEQRDDSVATTSRSGSIDEKTNKKTSITDGVKKSIDAKIKEKFKKKLEVEGVQLTNRFAIIDQDENVRSKSIDKAKGNKKKENVKEKNQVNNEEQDAQAIDTTTSPEEEQVDVNLEYIKLDQIQEQNQLENEEQKQIEPKTSQFETDSNASDKKLNLVNGPSKITVKTNDNKISKSDGQAKKNKVQKSQMKSKKRDKNRILVEEETTSQEKPDQQLVTKWVIGSAIALLLAGGLLFGYALLVLHFFCQCNSNR